MMKVLVSDSLSEKGVAVLEEADGIEADVNTGLTPEELKGIIGQYEGLIIRSATKVTSDIIEAAHHLRVIGRAGIGLDNVDIPAASKRGIVVMNTPEGNTITTAEHTVALMMSLSRNIPQATASLKAGKWEKKKLEGRELFNKTLGLIGAGHIGRIVAERAKGLRMKVIVYDPYIKPEVIEKLDLEPVSLDELLQRSDYITIHTPRTEETKNLMNKNTLGKMKKGAMLINCARGGIVNEEDLFAALSTGHLGGAALDVFSKEPAGEIKLMGLPNFICTPHLGASTGEAQVNVAVAIAQQVAEFLTKGTIQSAVNAPSLAPDVLQVLRPFLDLAEKLGQLAAQLHREVPRTIEVLVRGDVAERELGALSTAVLRGLLDRLLGVDVEYSVNYVNAPGIARDRGIRVITEASDDTVGYRDAIDVRVVAPSRTLKLQGAVFGGSRARLTRIDDFFMEALPEGYILMLHNRDMPGVVGNVGTLLGQNRINIAGVELGREQAGGMAISLFHVDEAVSDDVLAHLRTLPHVVSADLLEL